MSKIIISFHYNTVPYFTINIFGKVSQHFYAKFGGDREGFTFPMMEFNFERDEIKILQTSVFSPVDKVLLDDTKPSEIYWKFFVDGAEVETEIYSGIKDINYIHDLYTRLHMGEPVISDSGYSSSDSGYNSSDSGNMSFPPPSFSTPLTIDANNVIGFNIAPSNILPLTTDVYIFVVTDDNPATDLLGNLNELLPNRIVATINSATNSSETVNLWEVDYDPMYPYSGLGGRDMRIGFSYNGNVILSNIVTINS